MARRTLFSDAFNRADINPLDGSWATPAGMDAVKIVGNRVRATSAPPVTDAQARHTGTLPNDQWAKIVLRTSSALADFASVGARFSSDGLNGYLILADPAGVRLFLQRVTAGTAANLTGSPLSQALVAGDELLIEVTGQSPNIVATAYLNGAQKLQATGDTGANSGSAWIELYPFTIPGDLTVIEIDDFASGDFYTPPLVFHPLQA